MSITPKQTQYKTCTNLKYGHYRRNCIQCLHFANRKVNIYCDNCSLLVKAKLLENDEGRGRDWEAMFREEDSMEVFGLGV